MSNTFYVIYILFGSVPAFALVKVTVLCANTNSALPVIVQIKSSLLFQWTESSANNRVGFLISR